MLSTDINLTTYEILTYYQNHWDIEVSYRYLKNSFKFDEYQVEFLISIK